MWHGVPSRHFVQLFCNFTQEHTGQCGSEHDLLVIPACACVCIFVQALCRQGQGQGRDISVEQEEEAGYASYTICLYKTLEKASYACISTHTFLPAAAFYPGASSYM